MRDQSRPWMELLFLYYTNGSKSESRGQPATWFHAEMWIHSDQEQTSLWCQCKYQCWFRIYLHINKVRLIVLNSHITLTHTENVKHIEDTAKFMWCPQLTRCGRHTRTTSVLETFAHARAIFFLLIHIVKFSVRSGHSLQSRWVGYD